MGLHRSVILWLCLSFLAVILPLRFGLREYQPLAKLDTLKTSSGESDAVVVEQSSRNFVEQSQSPPKENGSIQTENALNVNTTITPASVANRVVVIDTSTVPYDPTQIVKPSGTIPNSSCTIVTSYFNVPSKFEAKLYDKWMKNMLALKDSMVIFTSPDYISKVQSYRSHASSQTVIVPMLLDHVPIATMFHTKFWERQFQKDREQKRHQSYQLFWIWLSKGWFITQAIEHNYFQSSIFVWSDIGTFRGSTFNGRTLVQHPELIPRHAILQMAHAHPITPQRALFYDRKNRAYHSGSHAAGYADTWVTFYQHFMETIEGFVDRDLFLGDDQPVLQSTCRQHPTLCAYVNCSEVPDNNYFGLRHVLHYGGNYTFWYPPALTTTEQQRLQQKAQSS
jgi:hypothetical protein